MKKIVPLFLILSATLSGCSPQASATQQNPIQKSIISESFESTDLNIVTAKATAKKVVIPDTSTVSISVQTEAATAEACQRKNAEKLELVLNKIQSYEITNEHITTSRISLSPQYSWSKENQTPEGYEMVTSVTVSSIPVAITGSLLSDVVAAGGNNLDNIRYEYSKYDETYQDLLSEAIVIARKKAESMVTASGYRLGAPSALSEDYTPSPVLYNTSTYARMDYDMAEAASGNTESIPMNIQPGEIEVTASVSASYHILP